MFIYLLKCFFIYSNVYLSNCLFILYNNLIKVKEVQKRAWLYICIRRETPLTH